MRENNLKNRIVYIVGGDSASEVGRGCVCACVV